MIPGFELQRTPYTVPMLVAAVLAAPVAGYAWRNRDVPGGRPLAALMTAVSFWAADTAVMLSVTSLEAKILFNKASYVAVTLVPVAWLAFASEYTGHDEYLTRRNLLAVSVVPLAVLGLVWTNELHGLIWSGNRITETTAFGTTFADFDTDHGVAFWAWAAYAYALILAGSALFVRTLYTADGIYRGQAATLLLAVFVPWVANAASLAELVPALDFTPLGFLVSGLAMAATVYRHRLLEAAPVARDVGRDEVIASMDDAVLILNRNDRVIDLNPAAEALLDRPAEAAVGEPLSAVLPALGENLAGRGTGRAEARLVVDGEERYYDVRVSAMGGHDLLEGRVVTMRDVTARRERRRELERYDRILNTVGDVIYAMDTDGRIIGVNDAAVEVIGRSREELLGTHVSSLMDEEDLREGSELLRELVTDPDRTDATFEMDLLTADGERIRCENHVALLPEQDGSYEGSVGILRDVTERRQRVQQLNVLNRVLRHDLRNDMNVIIGNAEMLLRKPDEPERRVREIRDQAEAMIDLSNKVRRIERTLDDAGEGPVDLDRLVADRVERVRRQYPDAAVETDLRPARAGASELVGFAVDNAVENAIEHNDGDPHVRVRVYDDPPDGVVVEVADDGPGIPETERGILVRGHETQLEHASGIGLWLINWIVHQSGGRVEFEENEPRGSVVRIRLPRAGPPNAGRGGSERTEAGAGGGGRPDPGVGAEAGAESRRQD